MPTAGKLPPLTAAVLDRMPIDFVGENVYGADAARELGSTSGDVMRRVSQLVAMGLVQRRYATARPLTTEIRRLHR